VTQDQLFQSLTEQAHEDGKLPADLTMKTIMDTWTHQSGYPLIRVFRLSSTHVSYTQEVFGDVPRKVNSSILDPAHFWYVPFSIRTEVIPDTEPVWLTKTQNFQTYGPIDTTKWILVNPGGTGYFKVLYDNYLTGHLVEALNANRDSIPTTSRSQLIDDYFRFALGQPSFAPVARAVDFTRYLGTENSLFPWLSFFNNMGTPFNYFQGHVSFNFFKDFYGPRVTAALRLIGEEQGATEKGANVILRARLLDWDCAFSGTICSEYSTKLFEEFVQVPTVNPVPADLRAVFYCAFVSGQGAEGLDFALGAYRRTPVTPANSLNERTRWRNAIGCAVEPEEIARVLDLMLDETSGILKPEQVAILQRVAMTREGRAAIVPFLIANLDDVITAHGANGVRDIISTLSQYVSTEEGHAELENFVEANLDSLESVLPAIRNSLNAISDRNIVWMDTYGREMVQAFIQQ